MPPLLLLLPLRLLLDLWGSGIGSGNAAKIIISGLLYIIFTQIILIKVTSFDESVGPRHPGLCAGHGKHTENAESDFHFWWVLCVRCLLMRKCEFTKWQRCTSHHLRPDRPGLGKSRGNEYLKCPPQPHLHTSYLSSSYQPKHLTFRLP